MSSQPIEQEAAASAHAMHSTAGSLLGRIFSRHLMNAAILMLIMIMFSGLRDPGHVLSDPDIFWHLADARVLWQTHHFIRVEPYSFSVAGASWVDPEWLSEMGYWIGYRVVGLRGVYMMTALAFGANILFVYWRSYHQSRHPGAALWVSALGLLLMIVNANARTILFAYLCMSAELAILDAAEKGSKRSLWLLPPLFCVWINLHGSWMIGIGLLALYIGCGLFSLHRGIFEQRAFSGRDRGRLLAVFGLSLAALFVNPYGWSLVWNPLDMLKNQTLNIANVQEWQPLNLNWMMGKLAVVTIGLTVLASALRSRKWKLYELAFVLFAWYAAFDHARFVALAAVITIPMLTADVTRAFYRKPPEKSMTLVNALAGALAIFVLAISFPAESVLEQRLIRVYPMQSIGMVQPGWRTLNQEHLGGIMDFRGKPTMIDTRWDTFEHHGVMSDFLDILHLKGSLDLLDKNRIDHVLLRRDEPLSYLLERSPGWHVLRQEGEGHDQYELFERVGK